ncbi:DNA-directed RNA polymerase II subunit RPB1-like [Aegilops tauschii subsp. strangulata]|nr:DNA-directed RNA polymerase II subunit RPB1-like [Aegilops tauschii subsp. strangulata]
MNKGMISNAKKFIKQAHEKKVKYDCAVRNSLGVGDVIQFLYGEYGMDAVWIEPQKLDNLRLSLTIVSEIRSWQITWPMPVNLKRPIWNAQKTFKIDLRRPSDMHPMEIVEAIDKLQERHLYTRTDEGTQLCL